MKAVLVALVLVGAVAALAAPASAMTQVCTQMTGNCGWYYVCVGAHYQNGYMTGCDRGVPTNIIPGCDPMSCDLL